METNTKTQKSVREEFLQKNVPCGLLTLQHVARKKKKLFQALLNFLIFIKYPLYPPSLKILFAKFSFSLA